MENSMEHELDENTILHKALQMPAKFIWVLFFVWIGIIAGLIYWMVI